MLLKFNLDDHDDDGDCDDDEINRTGLIIFVVYFVIKLTPFTLSFTLFYCIPTTKKSTHTQNL